MKYFQEIDCSNNIEKVDLKEMASEGKIYLIRNYKPLKDLINKLNFPRSMSTLEDLNNTNKLLQETRKKGIFAKTFLDFIKKNNLDYDLSQIDFGFTRIVLPEKDIKKYTKEINNQNIKITSLRNYLSPPHRDLNRPHYNIQCNFWWTFNEIQDYESLVFFPQAFKKRIFPYLENQKLDVNNDAKKVSDLTSNFNYKDFKLGIHSQPKMRRGDFIFFNSEHYHCSPKGVKNHRISCDLRYVNKSFDSNDHYMKNSFIYIKNLEKFRNNYLYDFFIDFSNLNEKTQREVFNKIGEDLKVNLLKAKKITFKINNLSKFLMIINFKSYYFIEQLLNLREYRKFKIIIFFKLFILSKFFKYKHYDFSLNPVNYKLKGHHPFTQNTPKYFFRK